MLTLTVGMFARACTPLAIVTVTARGERERDHGYSTREPWGERACDSIVSHRLSPARH
jgi:hypothetical protein